MAKELNHNHDGLVDFAEQLRADARGTADSARRTELGQFFTPAPTARLMASMFEVRLPRIRLLDAGAGVGNLTAALVAALCEREQRPEAVFVTAYEVDPRLTEHLRSTLEACQSVCEACGVLFSWQVLEEDFIEAAVGMLRGSMFGPRLQAFDCAILNPPYRKISSDSRVRHLLRTVGIETSNLYTAFLSLVVGLLDDGGELVTITPRSFCNGLYFKPFRKLFLRNMVIRRVRIFDARDIAFGEDDVLQENVILHSVKHADRSSLVLVSSSSGPEGATLTSREVPYSELVRPGDPNAFIHIVPDNDGQLVAQRVRSLAATLGDLNISVSTGRVVEFRARSHLRVAPSEGTVPLIYPSNFAGGFVEWPKPRRNKPTAIEVVPRNEDQVVPSEYFVLVKRFSSKEERRRVVAAVYDPTRVPVTRVGFENHLNYYHVGGRGLPPRLAMGLAAFLNSTIVDTYFRQFNGHTQVNATDLRSLRYPALPALEALGEQIGETFPSQDELDRLVEEQLP